MCGEGFGRSMLAILPSLGRKAKAKSKESAVDSTSLPVCDRPPDLLIGQRFDKSQLQMILLRTMFISADCRVRWHNLLLEIIEHPMVSCVWNVFLLIAIRRLARRINVRTSCILCGITGPVISMPRMWIDLNRLLLERATSDIDGMAFVQGWSRCSADSAKLSRWDSPPMGHEEAPTEAS
jgi:hypothetical protein